jgi:tRNA/tmRNA/rRNA uracil-C5-methylase (TrmA/RlmC/RlmD family)
MKRFRLDLIRLGLAFRLSSAYSSHTTNITQCPTLPITSKHLAKTRAPLSQAIATYYHRNKHKQYLRLCRVSVHKMLKNN